MFIKTKFTPFSWLLPLLLFSVFISTSSQPALAVHQKRVLLLSSYHPAFPTFFEQVNGIKAAFEGENIELDIEFMDSKRFDNETNIDNFFQSLSYKLSQLPPYDVVIVSDDNALHFLLKYQTELFPATPIVFLGVNDLDVAMQQNQNPTITGIVEAVSMADTIDLMLHLTPNVSTIYAIVDGTASGQGDLKSFREVARAYPTVEFSELSLTHMTFDQLADKLTKLPDSSAVLLLSAYTDSVGKTVEFAESLQLIRANLKQPLYHLWYHGMGSGILGGKLISHFEQGNTAGQMALQILHGTPVRSMPVINESPNKFIFDYNEMKRFNIPESNLPPDSIVLNQPQTFYSRYKTLVWSTIAVFTVLMLLIAALVVNTVRLRRTQQKLRESEEKFRAIFEQAGVGVSQILSKTGEYVDLNQCYADILGYTVDELRGLTFQQMTHPDDLQPDLDNMQHLLNGEITGFTMEKRLFHKNGSTVWVNLTVSPMWSPNQEPVYHIAVVQNITAQKQTQTALKANEEKYRTLFESLPIPVFTKNREGVYTSTNAANYKYWHTNPVGHTDADLLSADDAGPLRRNDLEAMQSGELLTVEETISDTPLGTRHFVSRKVPLHDAEGTIIGILGASVDITDRKQVEEERLKLKKLESVGVLAGGIAHDFNNLLTGLFGNIELARIFIPANHKSRNYLEAAMQSMKNATDLTQQLLTFAKGGDPIKETLSIAEVIAETARFSLRGSNVKLQLNLAPDLWLVEADKGQLSQVISNLVINAQQAMPAGGIVAITATNLTGADVRQVKIAVQDQGVGIDPKHFSKIFDPYFTTKQKGSGLGLATTYSIISKHDGTISVQSQLGKGTTFTILLPASAKVDVSPVEKPVGRIVSAPQTAVRVLILDDEESVRDVFGMMFEQMGYQVDFAIDGQKALAKYQACYGTADAFSLVIADLTIPGGMGGREAAAEILKIDPHAKMIVASGYATDPIMANYKTYGFKGVVKKPCRYEQLQAVTHHVLFSQNSTD